MFHAAVRDDVAAYPSCVPAPTFSVTGYQHLHDLWPNRSIVLLTPINAHDRDHVLTIRSSAPRVIVVRGER